MENVNFNLEKNLERKQILQEYTETLSKLRILAAKKYGLRPWDFDQYIQVQYFAAVEDSSCKKTQVLLNRNSLNILCINEVLSQILERRKQLAFICLKILLIAVFLYAYHKEWILEHNSAAVKYKGIRLWRRLTLPIIQHFPSLTELYDETCLMENPFFQSLDLSCDICAQIQSVEHLSDFNGVELPAENTPYIIKIDQNPVQLEQIQNIYASNENIFQKDAFRVSSSNVAITNLAELFSNYNRSENDNQIESHSLWRCNRMHPLRLLRPLFVRPTLLPNSGLALERYLSVDTSHALAYTLPDTKCSNVYVQQLLGARMIILRPTSECRQECRSLSVRLPQSYMLTYNWLYWRPISTPDPIADSFSITLIGSYC